MSVPKAAGAPYPAATGAVKWESSGTEENALLNPESLEAWW